MQDDFTGPDKEAHALRTVFRNESLQAGYFTLATRAIGLDCGPMSGFDAAGMDTASGMALRCAPTSCHGDPAQLFDRLPRLAFEEACRFA